MNKIILVLILLSSSVAYAGDPYVKTFYKGQNWTVLEVGITGECKLCALRSSPFYLDNGKNPKYGTTYLEISYPSNNVTFSGENIGAYFRISKQAMLQVDHGESIAINPETPMPGKSIVENMMKGMTAKITIDFGGGPLDIHTFSLLRLGRPQTRFWNYEGRESHRGRLGVMRMACLSSGNIRTSLT
jgi:hypothetical protein